jgi:hypothetical protein
MLGRSRHFRYLVVGLSTVGVAASLVAVAPVAHGSDDVARRSANYADASRALASNVVLWKPTYTAGLKRKRAIDVIAFGKGAKRSTFAGSSYGSRGRTFTIAQRGSATRWAAKPVSHSTEGLVDVVPVRMGPPGSQGVVRARVYANCLGEESVAAGAKRCSQGDVSKFGGSLVVLARTSVGGRPQASEIRIDSTGLTYRELLRLAQGMTPLR